MWRTDIAHPGPSVIAVRAGQAYDITHHAATTADLFDAPDAVVIAQHATGEHLGSAQALLDLALSKSETKHRLLAPCDVQAIKACGVTFAVSLLERVIEQQAAGDARKADALRAQMLASLGSDLSLIVPGSAGAARLKADLIARGLWSPYMEVGIGPDAEVFTKSQPMSAVGYGADVGILADSHWNNPEPEVVLAVNSRAQIVGATLGNDVNLRDIEGRSALLLGKAKDNNASCAIGSFIRLFDANFTLDTVRAAELSLSIEGEGEGDGDGFELSGTSRMAEISRDPADLVRQTMGAHHQYPDGLMLFLGTMFSPIKDRGTAGAGFTHHLGDRVTIASSALGALVNHVQLSHTLPPWAFGVRGLYANLAQRGFIKP